MLFQKIKSYKTFYLEIVAIFIGITASFWVDDYRSSLQDDNLSEKYLRGFIEDFNDDKEQLNELLVVWNSQLKSAEALLDSIESQELDVDSFYQHYHVVFPSNAFIPNSNTIEEILNSSHLRLISNESLKNAILEQRNKYRFIASIEEHIYQDRSVYLYSDLTLANIDLLSWVIVENGELISNSKNAEVYRRDAEDFLQDRSFKSFMVLMRFNLKYLIPMTEEVRDQGEAIVAQIQQELKR